MKKCLSFLLLLALMLTAANLSAQTAARADEVSATESAGTESGTDTQHIFFPPPPKTPKPTPPPKPTPVPKPTKTPPPPKPTWIIPTMKPNPPVKPGHVHVWEKCYTYRTVLVPNVYWDGYRWVIYYQQQTQRILVVRCRTCGYILSISPY